MSSANPSRPNPSTPCSPTARSWRSIDVREELTFSQRHLLWARNVPLSRLELRFARLVPRHATRIVLVDDGDGLARARRRACWRSAGYTDLSILDGGVTGWEKAGFELFSGVNVPSKAFGEHVEHDSGTPTSRPTNSTR